MFSRDAGVRAFDPELIFALQPSISNSESSTRQLHVDIENNMAIQ